MIRISRNAFHADALHLRIGVRRGAQPGADRQPPKLPGLQARGNCHHVQVWCSVGGGGGGFGGVVVLVLMLVVVMVVMVLLVVVLLLLLLLLCF